MHMNTVLITYKLVFNIYSCCTVYDIVKLKWSKTSKFFFLELFAFSQYFRRILAPAQRAAGGCSPLKVTPGRGPAARRIFFSKLIKINDFLLKIIIILCDIQREYTNTTGALIRIIRIEYTVEYIWIIKIIKKYHT